MEGMEGRGWIGELWVNMEEVRRQAGKARLGGMMRWGKTRWNIWDEDRGSREDGSGSIDCYTAAKRDFARIFYTTSTPPPQPAPHPTSISP
jgi:hypothetical protein